VHSEVLDRFIDLIPAKYYFPPDDEHLENRFVKGNRKANLHLIKQEVKKEKENQA